MAEEFEIDQRKFILDLIHLYHVNTVLWDKKHKYYSNRKKRAEAYEILEKKCKEYYPEADDDYVRTKLDSLRTAFRRDYKKVVASRIKHGVDSPVVYQPSLWYYNYLLFLVGEKCSDSESDTTPSTNKTVLWNRIHTAKLLLLLKKFPCLYSQNDPDYGNNEHRNQAYKDITDELIKATGRKFEISSIRKKVQHLRDQYRSEMRRMKNGKGKTSLWCYDLMNFLWSASVNSTRTPKPKKKKLEVSEIVLLPTITTCEDEEQIEIVGRLKGDIYEKIGDNVAHKLRQMDPNQRKDASRLINDILYHGQMEELTHSSQLILQVDDS